MVEFRTACYANVAGRHVARQFPESVTFTLVHDSPMMLVAYYVRAVNNLDLPVSNPDAHFAWGGSG